MPGWTCRWTRCATGLDATRPKMGSYVEISYTDTDRANVEAVLPHLIDSLDQVYADTLDFALAETENELRPVVPGESRVYTGPAYLDAFPEPEFSVNPPRTAWYAFVGFLVGALAATGILLGGQRRPRVTSTDDLREHLGYPAWAHVGGSARRRRPSRDQYAQVLATAGSLSAEDHVPRRIVVAPPHTEPLARSLAIGLAAEVVALGGRALLVDADVDRPVLSARLGGLGRPGLRDVGRDVELSQVIRRVNPLRLPKVARRMVGADAENLRFVAAGRWRRSGEHTMPLGVLDQIDPDGHRDRAGAADPGRVADRCTPRMGRRPGALRHGGSHHHPGPRGRCSPGALVLVRADRRGAARWLSADVPDLECRVGRALGRQPLPPGRRRAGRGRAPGRRGARRGAAPRRGRDGHRRHGRGELRGVPGDGR